MKQDAEDVEKVFCDDYSFHVTTVSLSSSTKSVKAEFTYSLSPKPPSASMNSLSTTYCGHGEYDQYRDHTWLRPYRDTSVPLDWVWAQEQLRDLVGCDILLLFDCCHATAMLRDDSEWDRRCEILGARNALDSALADRDHSFTQALISQLKANKENGAYVSKMARALTNSKTTTDLNLEKAPDYSPHTVG